MGKIQFDLQTWLKDKSQQVVTRKNIPVRIICTDCNCAQPIVAIVPTIDGKEETVETYTENGRYFNSTHDANLDLFIVTEDEPITKFENGVIETILAGKGIVGDVVDPRYVKSYAKKLLSLAKEQLKAEGWEYTDPLLKAICEEKQKESNIEKLHKISTPADENWFEIQKQWEKEDKQKEHFYYTYDDKLKAYSDGQKEGRKQEKEKFANEIIAEYKRVLDLLPDADKDSFTTEETIMYGKFMELETLYDKFCEPIGVTLEEEEKNDDKLTYTVNGEPFSKEPNIVDVSEFVHEKTVDYDKELKKCKENPLYFYDKYVKVKMKDQKQKWSEEDEETIKSACCYLNQYGNHIADVNMDKSNRIYKTADALKSLHPCWKPSMELMEYLAKAIITLGEEGDGKTAYALNEIRKHLKDNKLKEE